ncbi:transmembrane protein 102 [Bombina bombina]|uniref:transmembrane protein 102 n=1 Tax=Bombina bombina TaxID=8345 RepID=UPI00235A8E03|nr:transmembrane protein 102 [Bombina bombina]
MTSSARPLTDLDFCSGSRIEELNKLMEELERLEDITLKGKEVLQNCVQAKDYIFSLLGHIQPIPNLKSLLLLSGGLCSGSLDVSPIDLGSPSPFPSPSISYTLLVPILSLSSYENLTQSSPCHFSVPYSLWDPPPPQPPSKESFVTPHTVSLWFSHSILSAASSFPPSPHLCLEKADIWGNCASVLLSTPSGLLRFDIVPVVEVQGWPPGTQYLEEWVIKEGDFLRHFHLLPWGANDQWRVGFPGVEFSMRRSLYPTLSRVLRACIAILGPFLLEEGEPGPYIVWATLLHACERLPTGFLCREQNVALCLLGLLDELSLSFLRGSCPNPFLSGCDLLKGSCKGPCLARWVSEIRAKPVTCLRKVVREAKGAIRGGEREEREEKEEIMETAEKGSTCYPS